MPWDSKHLHYVQVKYFLFIFICNLFDLLKNANSSPIDPKVCYLKIQLKISGRLINLFTSRNRSFRTQNVKTHQKMHVARFLDLMI